MAHDFRLGPAILKADDSPQLPDLWLDSLLHKHLDGPGRAVVAQVSKASRSWLLSEWPQAALTIRVRAGEPPARLLARMQSAQQQVAQRGSKATQLSIVQQGEIPAGDAWWPPAATLAFNASITSLSLQLCHISADLLDFIGPALPALGTLQLRSPDGQASAIQLPAPSALRALRSLSLVGRPAPGSQDDMWLSLGPLLPQLTSLVVGEHYAMAAPLLGGVFTAAHTTHTLTHLELPCELTPWLAGRLQQHVPALQEVTVTSINAGHDGAQPASVCSWHTVRCRQRAKFPLVAWGWLPLPAQGKLAIVCPEVGVNYMYVEVCLPLVDIMVRKLANIAFTGDHEYKLIAAILQPHDEPAALRAALPILTSNTTINTSPALEGFTMSAELAAVIVAAAGPGGVWSKPVLLELTWPADAAVVTPLPQLGYVDLAGPLDSDTLAQMLACVREAGPLCVPDLDLDVPRPEGSMWPFHSVKLYNEVDSGEARRLAEQVSNVRISHMESFHIECDGGMLTDVMGHRWVRDGLSVFRHLPVRPQRVYMNGTKVEDLFPGHAGCARVVC